MPFPEPQARIPSSRNEAAYEIVKRSNRVLLGTEQVLQEGEPGQVYYGNLSSEDHYVPPVISEQFGDLRVPLAQQIVSFSAHRVIGNQGLLVRTEAPESEQWLLGLLRDTNFDAELTRGLEWAASYGGVYLRPVVSETGVPYMTCVRPDYAEPSWSHGRLKEAVLRFPLRKLTEKDKHRYILFEYHHMVPWVIGPDGQPVVAEQETPDEAGMLSVIDYRLYRTKDIRYSAGTPVPLTEHVDTVHLAELPTRNLIARRTLEGFDRISVEYVPNILGRTGFTQGNDGRSDLEPVYDLLEAYDMAWTTVIDEMDLGRPKILTTPAALQTLNNGRQVFDSSNRVFQAMNWGPDAADTGIQQIQWQLQLQERLYAVMELKVEILELAGWSPQSFGEHVEASVAESGTAKEYREQQTRDSVEAKRKNLINPARRTLENLCKLGGLGDVDVEVRFGPQNVLSQMERTEDAIKAYQNGIATLADAVETRNPGLNAREIEEKVEQIWLDQERRMELDAKFQDMRKMDEGQNVSGSD